MKRNWTRKLIGGLSFTSAMFVFQACYGTPQDFGLDILIEGQVKSVEENMQYDFTNDEGKFSFYTEPVNSLKIKFEDVDFAQYGTFVNKDTIPAIADKKVYLNIALDSK